MNVGDFFNTNYPAGTKVMIKVPYELDRNDNLICRHEQPGILYRTADCDRELELEVLPTDIPDNVGAVIQHSEYGLLVRAPGEDSSVGNWCDVSGDWFGLSDIRTGTFVVLSEGVK